MSDKAIHVIARQLSASGYDNGRQYGKLATDILAALQAARMVVVELPAGEEDGDGQLWFDGYDIRVDTTGFGTEYPSLYVEDDAVNPSAVRRHAAALLAAAEAAEREQP